MAEITRKAAKPGETGLFVKLRDGKAEITCGRECEFRRGLGIVKQWEAEGRTEGETRESPAFAHLTYMIDCSRNAVPSIPFLHGLIDYLAFLGYDRLMLYTEDTYEIEGRPYFGWMRGRYSQEDVRALDAYAAERGIALVPCIQTLAHLNTMFHWRAFEPLRDTADILNCADERTYSLIEDMIRTWAGTIRSRVINVGMDESEMLGRGRYLAAKGYEDTFDIMIRHLTRVLAICEKYGFHAMMWSDMFFKLLGDGTYLGSAGSGDDADAAAKEKLAKIRSRIPADVELIYWDYDTTSANVYDGMMDRHQLLTDHVGFAGGAWKWSGYAPLTSHSLLAGSVALDACRRHGITNVIVTGWGDDGGEASQMSVLPVLTAYAEYDYTQNTAPAALAARLHAGTGEYFDDLVNLELPNLVPGNPAPGKLRCGVAKSVLYNDPLLGIYDYHLGADWPAWFGKCRAEFHAAAAKGTPRADIYETMEQLSAVLEKKADIGFFLRKAYLAGDLEKLEKLAEEALSAADDADAFREALYRQWTKENRPQGFEVLEIRLAGVAARLRRTNDRIRAYLDGTLPELPELAEARLSLGTPGDPAAGAAGVCDSTASGRTVTSGNTAEPKENAAESQVPEIVPNMWWSGHVTAGNA